MKNSEKKYSIDTFITLVLIQRLLTPITKTKAFKLKLIDSSGNIKRLPETEEEKSALTLLDKTIFKLKKLLGSRISELSKYTYIRTLNLNNLYDSISTSRDFNTYGQAKKLKEDILRVLKENNGSLDDFIRLCINEEIDASTL